MKKTSTLSTILLCGILSVSAQDIQERKIRFDMQIAQSFGLNDWNKTKFASDRLPRSSSSTDLRATINMYIIKRIIGLFYDMGAGIMPAPRNGLSDPAKQAAFATGIPFYTKEITVENGSQSASALFKTTFGIFGKFPIADRISVLPYFGVGSMAISAPNCEAILKEYDTNMQYTARYQWFEQNDNAYDYSNATALSYLACRLRFAYHISPKYDLLFGLEYTWYNTRANFFETYTNYFNHNIVKTINHKGNQLNLPGFSVGISF
jgi:hypothetical protein